MELRELKYLVMLAEEKNISHAAEKLYITQSTLSTFIKQMETELHTKLFARSSRGISPTPSGQVLIDHARRMIQEFQLAQNEISDLENLRTGEIRLGISTFRGTYILPHVLKSFHQQYPGITVTISEANTIDLEQKIIDGVLDLALVTIPYQVIKGPAPEPCIRDEISLVTLPDHPILKRAFTDPITGRLSIDINEIVKYPVIMQRTNTVLGNLAGSLFARYGIRPHSHHTSSTPLMAFSLIRSGLGIGFSFTSTRAYYPDLVYLALKPAGLFVDLTLVYPHHYVSKACRALSQCFYEYGKESLEKYGKKERASHP
ncbi:LysR family transcriptional regulator [Acidaminococcus fermentans]|uniref:LysR family transcriptional regulator n=1 Tax=Acidaminococcus fermentans TaxID=905 RepID=UPI00242BA13C|nr:LysR family transcriptional regulator [Acidaminococcus fermentans]